MARLYNLARMTTSTTGTGTLTLGSAVSGFLSFSAAGISDGETVTYAIEDGTTSEIGRGVYTASGTTLTRNVLKSTNSNSAINLSGSAQVFITPAAEDLLSISSPGGRLTLTSVTPVLTGTVSGATTIYYTPYRHRLMPIYDGTSYTMHDLGGELSNITSNSSTGSAGPAACTTNSNYDLFVWDNAGTKTLTRGPAWTSDTARGTGAGTTELQMVAGIYTNKVAITNGPAANRGTYVGTVRTNGSSQVDYTFGSLAASGGAASFGVWNAYNRRTLATRVADTTDSWTYATTAWRAANNSATMRASYVCGLAEDAIDALYECVGFADVNGNQLAIGIGVDSTTAFSGTTGFYNITNSGPMVAKYGGMMGLGFHYLSAIEYRNAGTVTFQSDSGVPTWFQAGLTVVLTN